MMGRSVVAAVVCLAALGCGVSDQELRQKTGDIAVTAKRAAVSAGESMKGAYDQAAAKGKVALGKAGDQLSDAALKAKIMAGFKLVSGLESTNIQVEVRNQHVFLSGTVPTALDKMKAEGVAYGVTGDASKFTSTIAVTKD